MFAKNITYLVIAAVLSLPLFVVQANAASEYEQWKQQQQQSFQEYKDKRDKEFTAFLEMHWKEMRLLKGFVRDEAPKPVTMPVAKPEPEVKPKPERPVQPAPVVIKPVLPPAPETRPVAPVVPPAVTAPKGRKITIDYYGSTMKFYYDPALKVSLPARLNEKAVSNFWSGLSKTDYEPLLEQIRGQAKVRKLNDWAVAVLTHKIADKIFPASDNRQSLLSWFLLVKLDYSARIAYDDNRVYLLVPSQQQLFSVSYFTFDNIRYYAIRFDGKEQKLGRVYTYEGHYPGAEKKLNMSLTEDFIMDDKPATRELTFNYNGQKKVIRAQYGIKRVDFFNTYPQMDLSMYFTSRVSSEAATPLQKQLAEYMKGMSEVEAVNFLLRFVQTSFQYKTDDGQFGKENYLFPEETLYYPYSDCEDRSVLFAWLVQSLLGLDVVGLDYPGHVATAVHFSSNINGDAITYNGKRYVVADPTYINATAGMTMPDYRSARPGVIKIQ